MLTPEKRRRSEFEDANVVSDAWIADTGHETRHAGVAIGLQASLTNGRLFIGLACNSLEL
jgi:hypothetical protein